MKREIMQATTDNIQTKRHIITVAAAYCPPARNTKPADYQKLFDSFGEKFIFGRDS